MLVLAALAVKLVMVAGSRVVAQLHRQLQAAAGYSTGNTAQLLFERPCWLCCVLLYTVGPVQRFLPDQQLILREDNLGVQQQGPVARIT